VTAGDRAPDAPCNDGAIRIFDVLRGPHATLLAFDVPDAELPPSTTALQVRRVVRSGVEAGPDAIVDTEGHAHEAYDIKTPTLLLVRPDGYVGCAADAGDVTTITEYLKASTLF
jgi:hypothetical protein